MTTPDSIRRAMLEGALHKANDAVHADQIQDFNYALQAYADSCAMLAKVMEKTEPGCEQWRCMESIVCPISLLDPLSLCLLGPIFP